MKFRLCLIVRKFEGKNKEKMRKIFIKFLSFSCPWRKQKNKKKLSKNIFSPNFPYLL